MRLAETRHNCFRRVGALDCRFLPSANWRLAEAAEHRAIRCRHGGTEHDQADVRREQNVASGLASIRVLSDFGLHYGVAGNRPGSRAAGKTVQALYQQRVA